MISDSREQVLLLRTTGYCVYQLTAFRRNNAPIITHEFNHIIINQC